MLMLMMLMMMMLMMTVAMMLMMMMTMPPIRCQVATPTTFGHAVADIHPFPRFPPNPASWFTQ